MATQAGAQSQDFLSEMQALIAPYIQQQQALAGGNAKAALTAAMPALSPITQGYTAAREQIANQLPAGAARDYALTQLPIQKNAQIGQTLSALVAQAPQNLAQVGSGFGSLGLQEQGAQLSALSGAGSSYAGQANTYTNALNAQEQAKASTMGFLGDIVSTAGMVATGGLSGAAKMGGGGGVTYLGSSVH